VILSKGQSLLVAAVVELVVPLAIAVVVADVLGFPAAVLGTARVSLIGGRDASAASSNETFSLGLLVLVLVVEVVGGAAPDFLARQSPSAALPL
jgi:hypothetical protein